MTGPPDLRPLRLGEVVDVAARLTRRDFAALVTILAVLVVWLQVLSPLLSFVTADDVVVIDGQPFYFYADEASEDRAVLVAGALGILSALGSLAALAAMMRLVGRRYVTGEAMRWGDAAGYGIRRIGSVLWIGILAALAVGLTVLGVGFGAAVIAAVAGAVGVALAIVAVIAVTAFMYTRLSLAFPALTEEDLRGSAAIRRSWDLVRGRWWPVFGALVLAFVIVIGVQAGFGVALVGVLQLDSPALVLTLISVLNIVAQVLVFPFFAATLVVLYYDQRVRKEGLDLELQTRTLGEPAPPLAPSPRLRTRAAADPPAPPPRQLDTPPPSGFAACPSCGRHVAAGTEQCPHCATVMP